MMTNPKLPRECVHEGRGYVLGCEGCFYRLCDAVDAHDAMKRKLDAVLCDISSIGSLAGVISRLANDHPLF